jgi:putative membrane protein
MYLYFKAFHIVAVMAWMAGMFYLPRLYVYHCGAEPGSKQSETFKVMERRLLRVIINPSMILAWVLGLWLAWEAQLFGTHWFQAKLVLALGMTVLHAFLSRWRRHFEADRNAHSAKFYRIVNEVPTVLMIAIVILVVIKPF